MSNMKNSVIIMLFITGILLSGCVGTEPKSAINDYKTDVVIQKGPIKIIDKSVLGNDVNDVNIDNQSWDETEENGAIIDNQGIDEYGGDNTDIDDISNYDADG